MSDIKKAFENGKAVIPFVTAGDPDLATTEKLLIEMSRNGADLIEIGIPFSDPIAEGVEIQEADTDFCLRNRPLYGKVRRVRN